MSNYSTLKAAISAVIKENNNHEITGQVLQTTLLAMVDSLAGGYLFKGIATPATVVGTPDENVFYIGGGGLYSNFGATPVHVPDGCIGIFTYNGSFENHIIPTGGVFDISAYNSVGGTPATYADLTAALGTNGANIPDYLRKGGMSVKFIQGSAPSSDNKYVQRRLMADEFTTDTTQWAVADEDVYVENPEWIYVLLDATGGILAGIRSDSSVDWAFGVPTPVKEYINNAINAIKNGNDGDDIDGLNKIIAFLSDFSTSDTLKGLLDTKVDKEIGKSLINAEYANGIHYIENPQFIMAFADANKRFLFGIETDGNILFGCGVPEQIREYIEEYVASLLNADTFNENELMMADLGGTNLMDYDTFCYNDYHEAQGMECYGLKVRCKAKVDTNILLFNTINHSYKTLQVIPAGIIDTSDYIHIKFDTPVELKANQYIGFNTNIKWRSYANNGINGSIFKDNTNKFVRNTTSVWAYGLYVRPIKRNQIRKTLSMMTDSIGTFDYVSMQSRNYWKTLSRNAALTVWSKSISGGTCIMQGLRSNGVSFTDASRWGVLFSGGATGKIPDIILIQGGINDFGTSPEDADFIKYAEIGSMDDEPSPTTSFYSAYKYLLQQLTLTYPGAQIICCTPPKMFATSRLSSTQPLTNNHGLKLSQFANAIQEVASEYGAQVVDLFSEMPATINDYLLYYADSFHPKDEGCAIMSMVILNKLNQLM